MDATELQHENQRLKALLEKQRSRFQQEAELQRQRLEQVREQHVAAQAQHAAELEQFTKTLEEKQQAITRLQHQIKLLLQKVRGSRQERIDPNQLTLFSLEELQALADELEQHPGNEPLIETEPSGRGKRRRGRKGKLPEFLPREIIRHELSEQQRACPGCGNERHEIGVETSEQLELVPAKLKVIRHDRVKYACRHCQDHGVSGNVEIADKPPQPIEKGLPGPGLCAYAVLSKFGDHTPLYRTEDITSRYGYTIRRSTQCGWQAVLADLALALVLRMKFLVLRSKVIHTDDTSIKLLEGSGPAQTAKFWPYLGDCDHPYTVFDFTRTRQRDGPVKFLEGFSGFLQADAYSGYDSVYAGDQVKEVACWVHARRYWHQALDNDALRANQALSYIARLAQIEKQLSKSVPFEDLQGHRAFGAVAAARKEHSVPILEGFKSWLETEKDNRRILPKSPIRSAFTYTLNQWDALCRYTTEGCLSFSNNLAVASEELDYLLPDIWLRSNPKHAWTIDQIRRAEREAKDV